MSDVRDFYELIGVPRDASQGDIQWAYERALNRANRDGAQRLMTELSQAYDTLSDPRRRSTYDRHGLPWLRERSPGAAPPPPPWRTVKESGYSRYDVVPVPRRRSRRWRVPTAAVFCLGIVTGLVLALQMLGAIGAGADPAPAQQQVLCDATPAGPAHSYSAPLTQPPACSNGAAPRVVPAR